jgi:hypothetical protein
MAVHKTHSFSLRISIYFVIPIVKLLLKGRIWNEDTSKHIAVKNIGGYKRECNQILTKNNFWLALCSRLR